MVETHGLREVREVLSGEVIGCFGNDFGPYLHSSLWEDDKAENWLPLCPAPHAHPIPNPHPLTPALGERKCGQVEAMALETRASFLNKLCLAQSLLLYNCKWFI